LELENTHALLAAPLVYCRYTDSTALQQITMNTKITKYGVKPVPRPKIPATKSLDLRNELGKQVVLSETKLVLRTHAKTFKKLADM
jgi:hypothetical protein